MVQKSTKKFFKIWFIYSFVLLVVFIIKYLLALKEAGPPDLGGVIVGFLILPFILLIVWGILIAVPIPLFFVGRFIYGLFSKKN